MNATGFASDVRLVLKNAVMLLAPERADARNVAGVRVCVCVCVCTRVYMYPFPLFVVVAVFFDNF